MKNYNTTDLDPVTAFERHIFHRDQFAHYLRWSHILKEARIGDTICDFGCGKANLLELLYRNRFKPGKYTGIDIREKTIEHAKEKFAKVDFPVELFADDIINPEKVDFELIKADKVTSFEVLEHVGKQNVQKFLKNMYDCGHKDSTYYISTPNFSEETGAAGNHTYDAGDGRGVVPQEFTYQEVLDAIKESGLFEVVKTYGTFASIKDYKDYLVEDEIRMLDKMRDYFDVNMISVIMAPIMPAGMSRNIMYVLKRK